MQQLQYCGACPFFKRSRKRLRFSRRKIPGYFKNSKCYFYTGSRPEPTEYEQALLSKKGWLRLQLSSSSSSSDLMFKEKE